MSEDQNPDRATALAVEVLTQALQKDEAFAWSWHCAVWASAHDEGLDTGAASRAAARFMQMAFKVDTTKNRSFNIEHLVPKYSPLVEQKAQEALVELSEYSTQQQHYKLLSEAAHHLEEHANSYHHPGQPELIKEIRVFLELRKPIR